MVSAMISVLATVSLLFTSMYSQQHETGPRTAKIDHMCAGLAGGGAPGFAVLARENGRTLSQGGYGVGDLRTRRAIDRQTDLRLASCTKHFTAMSIMLLVHDGKLRYEDRLTDVFTEFPD